MRKSRFKAIAAVGSVMNARLPKRAIRGGFLVACLAAQCISTFPARADAAWEFKPGPGRLEISFAGSPVATYVYRDEEIPRPYFAQVFAPHGIKVTRNHPPIAGKDDLDHGTPGKYFHPGIWLAFSNVNGNDYWRLKARVDHVDFVEPPAGKDSSASFTVRNAYRDEQDASVTVFHETCRYSFAVLPDAYLLICDSAFSSPHELVFGDEEEMGLGARAATPMAVKHGGRLMNSRGERNESGVWGREAAWCDYGGRVSDTLAGILLVPDPDNAFASRFHARDTSFMTANPFGRKVFGEADEHAVVVKPGDVLRLRFAIVLRAGGRDGREDLGVLAGAAKKLMAELPRPVVKTGSAVGDK